MSRERWPVASGVRGPVFVKWDRQKTVQLGAIPGIVYDPRPLGTPLVRLQPYAVASAATRGLTAAFIQSLLLSQRQLPNSGHAADAALVYKHFS